MQEQLITFETAKLAKEKGFNVKLGGNAYHWYKNEDDKWDTINCLTYTKEEYPAPTQSLLQKWLMEVHQIYVTVEVDCTTYPKFAASCHRFIGNPKDLAEKEWYWETNVVDGWSLFRTYEEALEEGLQEALKLIEI